LKVRKTGTVPQFRGTGRAPVSSGLPKIKRKSRIKSRKRKRIKSKIKSRMAGGAGLES
jgi:hypothetical protein